MKIGFDVSDLATDRADGTTRYTRELAARLPDMAQQHEWIFFSPFDSESIRRIAQDKPNVKIVLSPWPKYWTQSRLWLDLYREDIDVLFMPIQQLPVVRPRKIKTVSTVHDLAFHEYGQHFTYKDWVLQHVFTAYVARQATRVIAVSKSTANDMTRFYGRKENIDVIHHGLDSDRFRLPISGELESSWEKLKAEMAGLRRPYLLYVGQIQPRKNLERLVGAFERLGSERKELHLVMAGGHGWLQKPIRERIEQSPLADRILLPGRVPDELLPALYWQAEVFVLPALYEGFGMPILEAMACGCPVVTSNVSSMPEVAGEAAVLVDPKSEESIASGIRNAVGRREELVHKGVERVRNFSWEKCARETLEVLLGAPSTR